MARDDANDSRRELGVALYTLSQQMERGLREQRPNHVPTPEELAAQVEVMRQSQLEAALRRCEGISNAGISVGESHNPAENVHPSLNLPPQERDMEAPGHRR